MCKILTVSNLKGGVGKTNAVHNLAYAFALQGKRILIADLDPQASLTVCFGVENHENLKTTIYDLILAALNDEPLPPKENYIINKGEIDLIPCNIGLSAIEDKLREEMGSERVIEQILGGIKADYDIILLDTAPSLNLLTASGIVASDGVIITVSPQYLSAIGLELIMKTISKNQKRIKPELLIEGVLMTMCDNRTNLCKEINDVLQSTYGQKQRIFDTQIPCSVKVGEANYNHKSVIEYDPKNKASIAYMALAKEILK